MTADPTWTSPPGPAGGDGTGEVDDVLRTVQALDERPVAEHVEVFETAHATLRRALDDRTS